MKNIVLAACIAVSSCLAGREEFQVKSTYVTVLEISNKYRFGQEDEIVIHFRSESGLSFTLDRPARDSLAFQIGRRYSFLLPR